MRCRSVHGDARDCDECQDCLFSAVVSFSAAEYNRVLTSPCYVQANFYSCGAYGTPVSNTLGGPTVLGCVKGNYSDAIQGIFENCATNELDHVAFIQNTLGIALYQ